jgi:SAM-dependent methyltransferase
MEILMTLLVEDGGPAFTIFCRRLKSAIKLTFTGQIGLRLRNRPIFPGSGQYWKGRYIAGGNSGTGSYGDFATFKSEVINEFVKQKCIATVIEFGCGDGNQLRYAEYPRYVGADVSKSAINNCKQLYKDDKTKEFLIVQPENKYGKHDLALSLDVIYHLVEDHVFDAYMKSLFSASQRFVIIYSSNACALSGQYPWPPHIRHRQFTDWIAANGPEWQLIQHIPNRYPYKRSELGAEFGSFANFYIFQRVGRPA